jgi:alkaline phosphatase D
MINEHNFGLLDFSGPLKSRKLKITLVSKDGKTLWKKELEQEK